MPLYEYQCQSCEGRFEKIQKGSDPPMETCPKCGGKVRKLPSSPAIQFKGSGFYINDYPKKSSTEAGKSGSSKDRSESSSKDKSESSSKDKSGSSSKDKSESSSTTTTETKTKTDSTTSD